MVEIKANSVVYRTWILKEKVGTPDECPWDLEGRTVVAFVHVNGATGPIVAHSNVTDAAAGKVIVLFDEEITAVAFQDGEQERDASLEFKVTSSDGTTAKIPQKGFIPLKINRDLEGGEPA